jgi:hypothetical protein
MRIERRERRPQDLRQWLAGMAAVLLTGAFIAVCHGVRMPVCVFHRLTGLPCLTCGSTRAAAALLAGDPVAAVRQQPLMIVGGAVVGVVFVGYAWCLWVCGRVWCLRLGPVERRLAWSGLAVLLALNWAYLVWRGM